MSKCVEGGEYMAPFIFLVMNTFHPGPEIFLRSDSKEIGKVQTEHFIFIKIGLFSIEINSRKSIEKFVLKIV